MPIGMRSSPIRGLRSLALGLVSLLLAALALAPQADGYIYWTNNQSLYTIGRANLDGTGVNQSLIPSAAGGVAVAGQYLYWADTFNSAIGRANLDGSAADHAFITGAGTPVNLAVRGGHIYWANDAQAGGAIGRANRDGSGVEPAFIPTGIPLDVAVDPHYVYWTQDDNTILRANLDGTGAATFVPNATATGVAVDRKHLYWTNSALDSIGRINLDGTGLTQELFSTPPGGQPEGIAVDAAVPTCASQKATVVGTGRDDKLRGTKDDDVIDAQAGDDRVTGLRGDDLVCAGPGDDRVTGGGGDDELRGKGGDDRLRGGAGDDLHLGGSGDDDCRGAGSERVRGC